MVYTVGQVAKELGIAPSALRYYDQEGASSLCQAFGGRSACIYRIGPEMAEDDLLSEKCRDAHKEYPALC